MLGVGARVNSAGTSLGTEGEASSSDDDESEPNGGIESDPEVISVCSDFFVRSRNAIRRGGAAAVAGLLRGGDMSIVENISRVRCNQGSNDASRVPRCALRRFLVAFSSYMAVDETQGYDNMIHRSRTARRFSMLHQLSSTWPSPSRPRGCFVSGLFVVGIGSSERPPSQAMTPLVRARSLYPPSKTLIIRPLECLSANSRASRANL